MTNRIVNNIPYGRQTISEEDIEAVLDVLRSPYLTQGPNIKLFEDAISYKVGSQFGVAVNSATSALHIACLALGLSTGDYIWTSPTTFVASANCGRYCGANVDFVDINPLTGLMSIEALSSKLRESEVKGTLPKIVIPVHLAGSSCDMKAIKDLSYRYGFSIIEDASHAIGGTYKNKSVGSCAFSDIAVFSFHPVKIITTGEGGLATTNNPILARTMIELRSHGITKDESRFEKPAAGPWAYEQQRLGLNYRMTDIQAALGHRQLQRLDEIVSERNRQLQRYRDLLVDLPVRLLEIPQNVLSSVHLAVIRMQNSNPNHHRKVFESLRDSGIGVQLHYSAVHLQPYYRRLGFKEGDFPESEAYANDAMSLPLFPGLQEKDQTLVVKLLSDALK